MNALSGVSGDPGDASGEPIKIPKSRSVLFTLDLVLFFEMIVRDPGSFSRITVLILFESFETIEVRENFYVKAPVLGSGLIIEL